MRLSASASASAAKEGEEGRKRGGGSKTTRGRGRLSGSASSSFIGRPAAKQAQLQGHKRYDLIFAVCSILQFLHQIIKRLVAN